MRLDEDELDTLDMVFMEYICLYSSYPADPHLVNKAKILLDKIKEML